jgi:hypothetical protein
MPFFEVELAVKITVEVEAPDIEVAQNQAWERVEQELISQYPEVFMDDSEAHESGGPFDGIVDLADRDGKAWRTLHLSAKTEPEALAELATWVARSQDVLPETAALRPHILRA